MKKRTYFRELGGAVFVSVLGTALHFLYGWSGESPWAAAFSGVNESTWEHMKLLFFPALVYTLGQLWLQKTLSPGFLAARTAAVLAATGLIPVLFYTYRGVLGRQLMWVNLLIFYLAAGFLFLLDHRLGVEGRLSRRWQQAAGAAVLLGTAMLFVYCTFSPPRLGLWQDPLTGGYGIG